MRVLVSGSTGLVGSALVEALEKQGHSVTRLIRPGTTNQRAAGDSSNHIVWDPVGGKFDAAGAEGADALVHLAGASIASVSKPTVSFVYDKHIIKGRSFRAGFEPSP